MLKKAICALSVSAVIAGMASSGGAVLPTITDYKAVPPFVSQTVVPNVMILLDTSGSMNRSFDSTSFVPATDINRGPFDQTECYNYQASTFGGNAFVPNPAANPPSVAPIPACTAAYPWSGNLLNWAIIRRADITTWALIGGQCATARDASLGCSHVKLLDNFLSDRRASQGVLAASVVGYMPAALIPSGGQCTPGGGVNTTVPGNVHFPVGCNVYFHIMTGTLAGSFCVDNDPGMPGTGSASCTDTDVGSGNGSTVEFAESNFKQIYDPIVAQSGALQSIGSRARFGLFQFNNAGAAHEGGGGKDGGTLVQPIGTAVSTMITSIEALPYDNWTPSAESLLEVGRYFAQIAPTFSGTDYTTSVGAAGDPYWFTAPTWAATAQYAKCCQSFVLFMTDGQPTQDTFIPAAMQDFAHTAGNHGVSPHCNTAAGCTNIYTSHANNTVAFHDALIDHHDECSNYYGSTGADPCQSNGSHYLDDVAYYLHITDLRQATIQSPANNPNAAQVSLGAGNDIAGTQSLQIYFFLTYETFTSQLMKDAAKLSGFKDINCDPTTMATATATGCYKPDTAAEWDTTINATGAAGSDGIPDNYFEADFGGTVKDQLEKVVESILQKSASGTAASVLASSATGAGALYQAYFFPSQVVGTGEVKWTGYTQGLFVDPFGNLREDTNADGRLVYSDDKIIKTRYDSNAGAVLVDYYNDTSPADGQADSSTPSLSGQALNAIKPLWEAGKQLALKDSTTRVIKTWIDNNPHNGKVDSGEVIDFTAANAATLSPWLKADAAAPFTATAIVNFARGCDPSVCTEQANLRGRLIQVPTGSGVYKVWSYGDAIDSTPTIVGSPSERFDILYGDDSYTAFFQQYKTRRQVAYVGANDGMMHAFNAGFFHEGDDPSTSSVTEHGYFTLTATDNSGSIKLGDELWGFIPQEALPHLRWLAQTDYDHVYYVDLKPKITDVKIFATDTDHPNGWGTILIGGMRMGGSCKNCTSGQATPMSQTADFGSGSETRYFYSSYFVLDITNPEVAPKLLWSFTDASLGLTTSYPAVVHINPAANNKADHTADKWFVVFGSGPTDYDAGTIQTGTLFVVDLVAGPGTATFGPGTALSYSGVTKIPTTNACGDASPNGECSFIGNLVALDVDLDYRTDAVYFGNTINNASAAPYNGSTTPDSPNPTWKGKLYRLTMGGTAPFGSVTAPSSWGISGPKPTELLRTFPSPATKSVRPISASPSVVLDDASQLWVFWGTGRYYSSSDKTNTETQYFYGVKDPVIGGGCTQSTATNCQQQDLVDMSSAQICTVCTGNQVTGVAGGTVTGFDGTTTTTLQGLVASKKGWFTTLPDSGERNLNSATVLGGIVFFPSYVPTPDICAATGEGFLYALYYKTGTAYKESVVGTSTSGGNTNVNRRIDMGAGLSSSIAIQIGGQGSGTSGSNSGSGCQGSVTAFSQTSTGALSQACTKPAQTSWSHYVSWVNQRE